MGTIFWLLLFVGGAITLAYRRTDLRTTLVALGAALGVYTIFGDWHWLWLAVLWLGFGLLYRLTDDDFRRTHITGRMLKFARQVMPTMSSTEQEALEAGTVWWDGELFSGIPDWHKLNTAPAPKLSDEEKAFLAGPTEELCRMLDEWEAKAPGRRGKIFSALMNARPSHLLDPRLFDFAGLSREIREKGEHLTN